MKLSPGVTHPLCYGLKIAAPSVSCAALLSLSQRVPGQGLTCGTGHWFSGGVSSPSPASLENLIFWWLLLGTFPECFVDDGLLRQVLMKVWIIFHVAAVVLRVSDPTSRQVLLWC